jgi:hypothetical protein
MTINNVVAWYDANGSEERNSATTNAGLQYPRGTADVIYAAGLMYSGIHDDGRTPALRTNGHSYNTGFGRGALLGLRTGVREDPAAPDVRIWRIRRDYATADLAYDAAEINSIGQSNVSQAQIDAVRAQYATDWIEWPAHKGAPFYDADGDGLYTPEIVDGEPVLFPEADEPGIADAHQVIWYVANDVGVQQPWTNVESGIEMQLTIWGYDRSDALGNVLFKKYRVIYKGIGTTPANATIDDMYMSQWADPDLGVSGDDFAGCDTVLSIGFIYNGNPTDDNFSVFGLAPPAGGYDFLQGPLVPGVAGQDLNKNGVDDAMDTGIFDLKRTGEGFVNLPMTAFIYFAAGGTYSDPPFNANGGIQWNQMLRGLPPTPQGPPDPAPPEDPFTNLPAGPYWLYGGSDGRSAPNPSSPNGWVDGSIDPPGDRRIILASGPFTMAIGDTQELVSAFVGGIANDYLASVAAMKFNDGFVQTAYDSLFRLPGPPARPSVRAFGLDNEVLLDWGFDSAAVAKTEVDVVIGNYVFEGYKIYHFPTGTFDINQARLLAQYDVVNGVTLIEQPVKDPISGNEYLTPVQYGTDNGIFRSLRISQDVFRGGTVVNGQPYYFGVSAYNYTPDIFNPVKTYESTPTTITVVPESPKPGTRYAYNPGDSVDVIDVVGGNSAVVIPVIVNPTLQRGDTYEIQFDTTSDATTFAWTLTNTTSGKVIFDSIATFNVSQEFHVVESGFSLYVDVPAMGVTGALDGSGANVFGVGSDNATFDVLSLDGTIAGLSGTNHGRDYEIRFDSTGSYVVRDGRPPFVQIGVYRAPFSVWEVGRSSADTARQVIAFVDWDRDDSTVNVWSIDTTKLVLDGVSYDVFEEISITDLDYPNTDTAAVDSTIVYNLRNAVVAAGQSGIHAENAVFSAFVRPKGGVEPPADGTVITFTKHHEMKDGDRKAIMLDAVTVGDPGLARNDVTQINAFPNPYYGLNRAETSTASRFITFNHLPDRATIRIFNLAGILVRTLRKEDPAGTTQYVEWDLQNDNGLPVASGIYIAYMELSDAAGNDLGTKTLKLAIIQEQQFLRNY